jgi:peptidoglycan/LPS O-acetylase OafA/YrhL
MPSGVPSDTVVASERDHDATVVQPSPTVLTEPARSRFRFSRFELGLTAIAAAGFAFRAAYILQTADDRSLCRALVCGDARYYADQAVTVADGHGFVSSSLAQQTADHPPLTALVLAAVHWLVPGNGYLVAGRLVMALIGSITVVGVGLLGRRVGRSSRGPVVGLIAAGIAAVNANFWMNDVLLMSETLAALGIVATLLAVYRYIDRPTLARAAAVGVLVGLCGLVRAELLLLGPITFVPLALRVRTQPWSARLARVALAAGLALAVLVPWTVYNLSRFEEPVLLSTNDGLTIVGANCDQMYGLTHEGGTGFWQIACAFVHENHEIPPNVDDSVRSRIYRQIGIDYARNHLARLRVVVEHRLLRGWGLFAPNEMAALNQWEGRAPWASWLGFVQWWLLLIPAAVGARVLRRRREPLWPLASMAVIVTLVLAGFYGHVRFRLGADVAAVVLAAVAVEVLARRISGRRWRALVRAAAPARPPEAAVTAAVATSAGVQGDAVRAEADEPLVPTPEPVPPSAERLVDGHFPCLDAYRGIGMTMVLLNHAAYSTGYQMRSDGAAAWITPIIGRFDLSVPMFFVLSGFLLFRPYARSMLSDRPLPDTRRFYRRRLLRILPSYWLALIGVGLLFGLNVPGIWSWLGNAVLAPAFGAPLPACQPDGSCHVAYGLTPAWSIGVEAVFYLLLPLFAFGLYRLVRRRPVEQRLRALLIGLGVLYACGTAFRVFVVAANPPWAEQALLWLPMFFDVFAVGMVLATISAAAAAGTRPLPRLAVWAGEHPVVCWAVAGAIFVVMTLLPYPERPFGLRDANGFSDYVVRQFLYGLASAAWLAPAMFGDQTRGRLRKVLSSRPLVYLGTISLSFYLWHLPLVDKVKQLTVPDWDQREALAAHPSPDRPLSAAATFTGSYPRVVLITFVVSLLVASFLYRYVELPFLHLKDEPLRNLWRHRHRRGDDRPVDPAAAPADTEAPVPAP